MAIENSLIKNLDLGSAGISETPTVRTNNFSDWLDKEKPAEKTDSFTLTSRPTEGMFNLEPVERYQYILSQVQKQVKLDVSPGDPQKTIKQANEIINNAIMPPSLDNPDRAYLTRAMQLKRMAESRLDIAA